MDFLCFVDSDYARTNTMSGTIIERTKIEPLRNRLKLLMKKLPRLTYTVETVFGDLYYKPIPIDKAIDFCLVEVPSSVKLNSDDDINQFIQDNISSKIPFT